MTSSVPETRVRAANDLSENPHGDYVLYWMVATRRTRHNFALQHAADCAHRLGVSLVILEPLRIDYPWACERFHRFVIDGMLDNSQALKGTAAHYYPFVEPEIGAGNGLLAAFSEHAALIVSDDSPMFFLPKMLMAAARKVRVRMELVDSNGLYPLHETDRVFTTAASFRRHLHKEISPHLLEFPKKNPLARRKLKPIRRLPKTVSDRFPPTSLARLRDTHCLSSLAIDHSITPGATQGGSRAATKALRRFLDRSLENYATLRNQPGADCQSHLAPYLHFGHISAHEVFLAVTSREDWSPARIADRPTGSRHGWWGASEAAESFIDQLVTWRELGHNAAAHQANYTQYESLPNWALLTLKEHASDEREYLYPAEAFESADTHDPLWNAAQRQLVTEGTIHNYLRMLWGKKILEWTPDPQTALNVMIELNNKYALDGRDPNSYSGIFWVLGRYDRAWGPERPIFGKVRYMSSVNTARKVDVKGYLERFGAA
jgi:deoxyribodipyrimidine photo-lyase